MVLAAAYQDVGENPDFSSTMPGLAGQVTADAILRDRYCRRKERAAEFEPAIEIAIDMPKSGDSTRAVHRGWSRYRD